MNKENEYKLSMWVIFKEKCCTHFALFIKYEPAFKKSICCPEKE